MIDDKKVDDSKNTEMVEIEISGDDMGSVKVSNNVIASIIKKYLLEVEGVVRTAPQGIIEGVASILSRRAYESSINIVLEDDGAVITLALVYSFGVSIPKVSQEVQLAMFTKIPELTGYKVKQVNVNVVELEDPEEEIVEGAIPTI